MISISTIMIAKEIDLTKSKGTNQEVITSLSPEPMDDTVKRGANIKITFDKKLKKKSTKKSIKLKYLGCKQEKEAKLKERRDENLQRCNERFKKRHLKKSCKQCVREVFRYQKKRKCKPKNIKGKTTYLKNRDILKFNPHYRLRPGYYKVTAKGLKTADNKKIKKIMYRFEVSKNTIGSITLSQTDINLKEDASTKLTLQATYKDGTTEDITQDINWIIGDATLISIDTNGNLKALKAGETLVQAEYHGKVSLEIKVTITVKAEVINGYTLPPEPDPVINNATLLGIDSNDNGIRDDVERWIVKTFEHGGFENNLYMRDKFLKKSKNYQLMLANGDPTPQEVLKLYSQDLDDDRCINFFNGKESKKFDEIIIKFNDEIFNTPERLALFFLYEKRLPMREFYSYKPFNYTVKEFRAKTKSCRKEYINFKGGK